MDRCDPNEYGLVMPFVNVTSKGGEYDDSAFCAGYEVGLLDAQLQHQPPLHEQPLHLGNKTQADLLAMHHGYRAQFTDAEVEGWTWLRLTRLDLATVESKAQ